MKKVKGIEKQFQKQIFKNQAIFFMLVLITIILSFACGSSSTSNSIADTTTITNSIGMKLVYIQPGTFQMGSPTSEAERNSDETQHKVTLTNGFYLQTTELTQGQWKAVMGSDNNPSYFKGDNLPVEEVSWDDCQEFIVKLNTLTGKNYRLPTEAEWQGKRIKNLYMTQI